MKTVPFLPHSFEKPFDRVEFENTACFDSTLKKVSNTTRNDHIRRPQTSPLSEVFTILVVLFHEFKKLHLNKCNIEVPLQGYLFS